MKEFKNKVSTWKELDPEEVFSSMNHSFDPPEFSVDDYKNKNYRGCRVFECSDSDQAIMIAYFPETKRFYFTAEYDSRLGTFQLDSMLPLDQMKEIFKID